MRPVFNLPGVGCGKGGSGACLICSKVGDFVVVNKMVNQPARKLAASWQVNVDSTISLTSTQSWRFKGSPRSMQEWLPWTTAEITLLAGGGSHEFDRARFLTGCEFVRVVGSVHPVVHSKKPEFIMPGAYSLVAELSEGLWGDFRLTITSGQPAWTLVINGEEGTLEVAHDRVFLRQAGEKEQRVIEVPVADQKPDGITMMQNTWDRLIADFVTAIRQGDRSATPHLPTLIDGLHGQEVIEAAQLAATEQRWVSLDEMR